MQCALCAGEMEGWMFERREDVKRDGGGRRSEGGG